ncbi:AsnC family transcriptional regulator [Nocardia niigatensis]
MDGRGYAIGPEISENGHRLTLTPARSADLGRGSGPADPGRSVRDDIGGLRGISSARMRVGITLLGEGGDRRMRALSPAERAELPTPRASGGTAYSARGLTGLSPMDQALVTALHAGARMSYTELGAAAGVSEHTGRRRADRLLHDGDVVIRCDFAYSPAEPWSCTACRCPRLS